MSAAPVVHVVDDNADMRRSLDLLLKSVALDVQTYATADEFLHELGRTPKRPGILLLDVRLPGMSGMTLLEHLRSEHPSLPVILITGHGDIDMAVRAMKLGAIDFITKPFSSQVLLDRIQDAVRRTPGPANGEVDADEAAARLATLTTREREVFDGIVSGDPNKVIASDLGISVRTVESHRANVMQKLSAKTLVDLVLIAVSQGRAPDRLT